MQRIIEIARTGQMIFLTWAPDETLQEHTEEGDCEFSNSSRRRLRTLNLPMAAGISEVFQLACLL
jgi:hypothetical protein